MKVRKVSIVVKTFVLLSTIVFVGTNILGTLAYNKGKESLYEQIRINAKNIAACAASNVDSELLNSINEGDEGSEAYNAIIEQLALFRDNSELEYIYTLRLAEDGTVEYVVDADTEEPADIGEECEATPSMILALKSNATIADTETVVDEWGTHLSAYSTILNENGSIAGAVGVDISADWIAEQIASLRNVMLVTAAIMFVACLVGVGLLMFSFRRSLCKLNDKVRDLTNGDGDLTRKVEIKSGDELEVIANSINEFIEQVRDLVKGVSISTNSVLATGEELNKIVVSNTDVMLDMSSQIQEVSASMQESSATSQILSATLSSRADDVKDFAESVNKLKDIAEEVSSNVLAFSNQASDRREFAVESVQKLQEQMDEISEGVKKIELIREIAKEVAAIAKQTNMLSLNAQIEAARAGEAGKGFAVVATQVGKLSIEINKAVVKVNQTSEQILNATETLTEVSDGLLAFITGDVVTDYESFAKVSRECGDATDSIREKLSDIACKGDEVANGIREIDEQVQGISAMVNATSESTVRLATATNQISRSMEDLSDVSKQNTSKSEDLSEQVRKYTF